MREEKSVYKALFSEQESKKVELGAIDDLKKKLDKNISTLDSTVLKVRGMAKIFVGLEEDFGKISNEASLIRKQLSDLGIDDPKDLSYIFLKAKEMEKYSKALKRIYKES